MNPKRITRLLNLLEMLQCGNGADANGLARACGVSRRTLFRDLETLREAGVPLEYEGSQKRYQIPSGYFLPPTNFTASEALAIISLASQLGADRKLPFYRPARRAALKLESNLPSGIRDELKTTARAIQIDAGRVNPLTDKEDVYDQLVEAISSRRVAKIDYESLTEWEVITTKLRPYQLLFSRHSWYVIGRSTLHGEVRTFNVGRISTIELLNERYKLPRGFSLKRYLGNAWHLIPEPGRDHNVHLHFTALVARNVAEIVWHKTQQVAWRKDGSLDFCARVSGLNEIAWWVLGYGDQCEVIRPKKLRRLIAHRVQNMHDTYNHLSDGSG